METSFHYRKKKINAQNSYDNTGIEPKTVTDYMRDILTITMLELILNSPNSLNNKQGL